MEVGGDSTTPLPPVMVTKSRWRPTTEQKIVLENLYKQGMTRPTTEQIQQIIFMLKAIDNRNNNDINVKGMSVRCWFQNHKSKLNRQIKKQNALLNFRHYHFHMHADPITNIIDFSCNNTAPAAALLPLFPLEPSGNLRATPQPPCTDHHDHVTNLDLGLGSPFHL